MTPFDVMSHIVPARSAVLVIDMQNDFCHEQGAFGKGGQNLLAVQEMVPGLNRFVDFARESGVEVVHIRSYLDEGYLKPPAIARNREMGREKGICLEGSWGAEFYGILPDPSDMIVTKHAYSAFIYTELQQILLKRGIQSVFVTGVLTNVCCESTLRHAYMLGFYTVLVDDCCASVDESAHLATVENVRKYFGWVMKASDVQAHWKRVTP